MKEEKAKTKDPRLIKMGQRIRQAREKAGFTQSEIYEKTGINTSQLSAYENGAKGIGLDSLARIASATETTIDDLYFGTSEERAITTAHNKGELIINCISALYDEGVVGSLYKKKNNNDVFLNDQYEETVGFVKYQKYISELVSKLDDVAVNAEDYPDACVVIKQIQKAYVQKINRASNAKK